MRKVAILNYGIGNVKSIANALVQIEADVVLTADRQEILNADCMILPGVGAFGKGMQNLREKGLIEIIHEFVDTGKPFLGICLGMQMLLDSSDEFGNYEGLHLIEGSVVKMPVTSAEGERLPHVSWNELMVPEEGRWGNTMLRSTREGLDVYFVHSFVAQPTDKRDILAEAFYGGGRFCAAIQKNNVTGLQFHPEKSGQKGLMMLKQFVNSK